MPDQPYDIAYLKIFMSETYIDLPMLKQDQRRRFSPLSPPSKFEFPPDQIWDAVTYQILELPHGTCLDQNRLCLTPQALIVLWRVLFLFLHFHLMVSRIHGELDEVFIWRKISH